MRILEAMIMFQQLYDTPWARYVPVGYLDEVYVTAAAPGFRSSYVWTPVPSSPMV